MDGNFRLCFVSSRSFRTGNEIIQVVWFDVRTSSMSCEAVFGKWPRFFNHSSDTAFTRLSVIINTVTCCFGLYFKRYLYEVLDIKSDHLLTQTLQATDLYMKVDISTSQQGMNYKFFDRVLPAFLPTSCFLVCHTWLRPRSDSHNKFPESSFVLFIDTVDWSSEEIRTP